MKKINLLLLSFSLIAITTLAGCADPAKPEGTKTETTTPTTPPAQEGYDKAKIEKAMGNFVWKYTTGENFATIQITGEGAMTVKMSTTPDGNFPGDGTYEIDGDIIIYTATSDDVGGKVSEIQFIGNTEDTITINTSAFKTELEVEGELTFNKVTQ